MTWPQRKSCASTLGSKTQVLDLSLVLYPLHRDAPTRIQGGNSKLRYQWLLVPRTRLEADIERRPVLMFVIKSH